jgi:hypothetical protein
MEEFQSNKVHRSRQRGQKVQKKNKEKKKEEKGNTAELSLNQQKQNNPKVFTLM